MRNSPSGHIIDQFPSPLQPTPLPTSPVSKPVSAEILTIQCQDKAGLVYRISGVLSRNGANIVANDEFVDCETGQFFMRTEFIGGIGTELLVRDIEQILPTGARVHISTPTPRRIVLLASREHHCIGELLLRHAHDELGASIVAVISNHEHIRPLINKFDVPLYYVSHEGLTREAHEDKILSLLRQFAPDLVVLAKYMRILSSAFVAEFAGRMINIHHSFLPAFVGSNPYRQAFERGVKIIGATSHFVTDELDEGPIIAQAVIPVDHRQTATDMARVGRDVEKLVLAKALSLVLQNRVFVHGLRTVVFA